MSREAVWVRWTTPTWHGQSRLRPEGVFIGGRFVGRFVGSVDLIPNGVCLFMARFVFGDDIVDFDSTLMACPISLLAK